MSVCRAKGLDLLPAQQNKALPAETMAINHEKIGHASALRGPGLISEKEFEKEGGAVKEDEQSLMLLVCPSVPDTARLRQQRRISAAMFEDSPDPNPDSIEFLIWDRFWLLWKPVPFVAGVPGKIPTSDPQIRSQSAARAGGVELNDIQSNPTYLHDLAADSTISALICSPRLSPLRP